MSKIIVKKIKNSSFAKKSSKMRKFISLLVLVCSFVPALAQNSVENFFRTDEKFYVVVAVLAIIMFGILLYVVRLDQKITNLEKQDKENFKQ
jgi:CcmD family protein